jgi:ABC-type multidrug transport system fused ATPase/permease subunit
MTIRQILSTYKYSILIVLSFVLLENIAWIIEPTFFGKLLDALIDRFYDDEKKIDFMTPLIAWAFVYLLNVIGGALSRYAGGRIYSKMYAEIATRVISATRKRGHPVSKMLARAELAKDYVIFLRERLPEITWQISATFGAIIAMFFYDWRIAAICLVVILPIAFINNLYRKNVEKLQKQINDTREDLYKVVEEKDSSKLHEFFFSMVAPQRKIARWNSLDYGIIKVFLMFIFIVVLFICVDVDKFSTGRIYSVVAYLWTFIASTDYLPSLMESITSVRELSNRLKEEVI